MKYRDNNVAREFDKYRENYSDMVNEALVVSGYDVDFFTRVKAGYIKEFVAAEFDDPRTLRVLDIGCGVGNLHPLLYGSFGALCGVDVSSECVDEASGRNLWVQYEVTH